jgi:hypothetical protein
MAQRRIGIGAALGDSPMPTDNPFLPAALYYARQGLPVFPCVPRDKKPLTAHGFYDASTDPAQIRKWWAECPDANVAIRCGALPAGQRLFVVDIDADKGGLAWLDAQDVALVPPTWTVNTGSGGLHKYYLVPDDLPAPTTNGSVARGVDSRGDGGYVIAPPSIHPNGTPYTWAAAYKPGTVPLAPAAAAGVQTFADPPPIKKYSGEPAGTALQDVSRWTPAELEPILLDRAWGVAAQAGRNNGGFWLACQLRDNAFSESDADRIIGRYHAGCDPGPHAYRLSDAQDSVRQAYRRPPRDPWGFTGSQNVSRWNDGGGPAPDHPPDPAIPPDRKMYPGENDVGAAEFPGLIATMAAELADLRTALEKTTEELKRRDAHVQWTHDLLRMPNVTPSVKITLYFMRWNVEFAELRAGATGQFVDVNVAALAEVSGQSAAVVGRNLAKADDLHILAREVRTTVAAQHSPPKTRVSVKVDQPFYEKASQLAPEAPVKSDQVRPRCKRCQSPDLRSTSYRCGRCGHEQPADGEVLPAHMQPKTKRPLGGAPLDGRYQRSHGWTRI